MAGPIPSGRLHEPRRITKVGEHSNPVIRSFIASFGVALNGKPDIESVLYRAFLSFAVRGLGIPLKHLYGNPYIFDFQAFYWFEMSELQARIYIFACKRYVNSGYQACRSTRD